MLTVLVVHRENWMTTYSTFGEGYHNYHHTFPYDYSASELNWKYNFNFTTLFIDFFAWLGWAYDLKKVSPAIIAQRVDRTGNGKMHDEYVADCKTNKPRNTLMAFVYSLSHLYLHFVANFVLSLV